MALHDRFATPGPNTRVELAQPDPTGWEAVKQWKQIREIIEGFPQAQLFVLTVDRDSHVHRRQILDDLETRATEKLQNPRRLFLAEHAWQEIEVWALAGIDWRLNREWSWRAIREERDAKERYFEPVVRSRGLMDSLGRGRNSLGEEAARHYAKVRQDCSEIRDLEDRIRRWLNAAPHR